MPKNKSKNQQYIKTDIDYERLADAIVKAHERIAKTEAKERESQEKAEHDEWFNIIGYVEYPENEHLLLKIWHSVKNDVAIFKSVITFKEKDAKKPKPSILYVKNFILKPMTFPTAKIFIQTFSYDSTHYFIKSNKYSREQKFLGCLRMYNHMQL